MISVIVCSREPNLLAQMKKSVGETIGVPYELVAIDNAKGEDSIFEAYNRGIEQSSFDILCFAHEDLIFHTEDWGQKVADNFEDSTIGMLGVNGGERLPVGPAPWWNNRAFNNHFVHNIQHWKRGKPPVHWEIKREITNESESPYVVEQYSNPRNEKISEALVLDGFFFCIPKKIFSKIRFDEDTFKGFHMYDSDISMQVGLTHRVVVVYDVLMEHLSDGTANHLWCTEAEKFSRKWRDRLIQVNTIQGEFDVEYCSSTLLSYCYRLKNEGFSDKKIREVIKEFLIPTKTNNSYDPKTKFLILWKRYGYFASRFLNKMF